MEEGVGGESKNRGKGLKRDNVHIVHYTIFIWTFKGKILSRNHILRIVILYYFPPNICLAPTNTVNLV